jgi:hypothetical protein
MTPSIAAIHDDLVAAAAAPSLAAVVAEIRETFERRVAAFAATDPWFEESSAAVWERVLVDERVTRKLALEPPEGFGPAHRSGLAALARAQRGLFAVEVAGRGKVDLRCVVTGAAFRLSTDDDAGRAMAHGDGSGGLLDAHVAPTAEGVALLPAALVHPAEATQPILELVSAQRPEDAAALLDALLAMRHRLSVRSRMRAKQVYRREALSEGAP